MKSDVSNNSILENFKLRLKFLSSENIISLLQAQPATELNNVVEGFEQDFFAIGMQDEQNLNEYTLTYIGNYDKLRGVYLETGRNVKHRDVLTLYLAKVVEQIFPQNNQLVIFNTFQEKLRQFYERSGILCLDENLSKYGDLVAVLPKNKENQDFLVTADILCVYRRVFKRSFPEEGNENGVAKVYLMYDKKADKIKIGETTKKLHIRKKGVAEPTLRAEDPLIELIVVWKAAKKLEKDLHKRYQSKRGRGEWFDLRITDLEEINYLTQSYEIIDFGTD